MRTCRPHEPTYRNFVKVGEGAYGAVFRAQDAKTGEKVALKRILLNDPNTPGLTVTTLREILHLFRVKHDNVVRLKEVVYEAGKTPSTCNAIYMVLEYLEHDLVGIQQALKARQAAQHPNRAHQRRAVFSISDVKCYMLQLLRGMTAMHNRNVLHRDLKTSNLLVSRQGVLKIADFGLSRVLPPRPEPLTPKVCTLWYRPPELLLCGVQSLTYGGEVDVWSAGCIFAEMLMGLPLFPEEDEVSVLYSICKTCGSPNPEEWPEVVNLPGWEACRKQFKENRLKSILISRIKDRRKNMTSEELNAVQEAVELVDLMLQVTPSKRLKAQEIWSKGFLQDSQPPPTKPCYLEGIDMPDAHIMQFEEGANARAESCAEARPAASNRVDDGPGGRGHRGGGRGGAAPGRHGHGPARGGYQPYNSRPANTHARPPAGDGYGAHQGWHAPDRGPPHGQLGPGRNGGARPKALDAHIQREIERKKRMGRGGRHSHSRGPR